MYNGQSYMALNSNSVTYTSQDHASPQALVGWHDMDTGCYGITANVEVPVPGACRTISSLCLRPTCRETCGT